MCVFLLLATAFVSEAQDVRVPAEWEPHVATWMQWPNHWESAMRPAFAEIIDFVQEYEPMHLLTSTQGEQTAAEQFLSDHGVPDLNITWHIIPVDNSWMRDNGPVYVTDGVNTWIQNWKFDAWGGNFGAGIPYAKDNLVPVRVAEYLGVPVEDHQDYVLEKGNLEFNGAGTLVLNWDCQDDRNPGMTQAEHEAILTAAFDLTEIIWAFGHDAADGTTGHIDGTARFFAQDTIVVADYYLPVTEANLVTACEEAGLQVIRYPGDPNWLVGNGFVAAMASDNPDTNAVLKAQIESLYPGRDVSMIDAATIASGGGGVHCVTNDQPVGAGSLFVNGFETGDTRVWSSTVMP